MEAVLQSRPQQTTLKPKHTFTLFTRVRARLSTLPPLPSEPQENILALPNVPCDTDSADTNSRSASAGRSDADTLATSVVLIPTFFSIHKVHVAPFEAIDEDLIAVWEQTIRERLCTILKHEITTGTHVQECIMAGRKTDNLKPTILVTSSDVRTKKRVEKILKGPTMKWLRKLAKEKDMQLVAAVDAVALTSASEPAVKSHGFIFLNRCVLVLMTIWLVIIINTAAYVVANSPLWRFARRNISSTDTTQEAQLFLNLLIRSSTNNDTISTGHGTTSSSRSGVSPSVIAGALAGGVVISAAIIACCFLQLRRRKKSRREKALTETNIFPSESRAFSEMQSLESTLLPSQKPLHQRPEYLSQHASVLGAHELPTGRQSRISPYTELSSQTTPWVISLPSEANTNGFERATVDISQGTRAHNSTAVIRCCTLTGNVAFTYCGQKLQLANGMGLDEMSCTLGGLVFIKGFAYCTTAYHPFSDEPFAKPTHPISVEDPFWYLPENSDDDTLQDNATDSDQVHSAVDESQQDVTIQDEVTLNPLKPSLSPQNNLSNALDIYACSATPRISSSPNVVEGPACTDWILLKFPPGRPILPNLLRYDAHTEGIVVNEVASGTIQGSVYIMYGEYARSGQLRGMISTLQYNQTTYKVQMLSLSEPLPMGCSGSWVVAGNKLCGHVIAIRHSVPWAYMVPIQDILQDMKLKLKLGTDNISLSIDPSPVHELT